MASHFPKSPMIRGIQVISARVSLQKRRECYSTLPRFNFLGSFSSLHQKFQFSVTRFLAGKGRAMQIQVKCSCGEGECPEWAIVELQGVVEANLSFADRLPNLEIGRLCHTSQGSYTFTVGYHELSGTKVTLKKPLLVLRKKKVMDEENPNPSTSSSTELQIVGIIRHRILFKTRPKALISRPQIKEKRANGPDRVVVK